MPFHMSFLVTPGSAGRVDHADLRDVEERDADVVDRLDAEHGLGVRLVGVVGRDADRVHVRHVGLGGEDALAGRAASSATILLGLVLRSRRHAQRRVVRAVVAGPALVEVVERELEAERRDAVVAHADLAVVARVAGVVALLEELRAVAAADAAWLTGAARRRLNGAARRTAVEEGAVDRVGERVENGRPHGPRQEGLLGGRPVAGVPVPLEEALRELPDVAHVVEELEHPERAGGSRPSRTPAPGSPAGSAR